MDEGGNLKDDLKLPSGTDEAEKLAKDLAAEFEDGKELVVTVIKVRGVGSGDDCRTFAGLCREVQRAECQHHHGNCKVAALLIRPSCFSGGSLFCPKTCKARPACAP